MLVTPCERAVWLTHLPKPELALDELDSYRCSIFRNEGAGLSSALIRAAMELTEALWGPPPPDGWVTWVDTRKIESAHPGFCFKRAGWWLDREWAPKRGRRGRIRLRASAAVAPSEERAAPCESAHTAGAGDAGRRHGCAREAA